MVPLTVDGLIYASSMVVLDSARREAPVPALARWLLGLGIAAPLAANVGHGVGHGPVSAAVAAWQAVAPVGSYELLMMVIRGSQPVSDGVSDSADNPVLRQLSGNLSSSKAGRGEHLKMDSLWVKTSLSYPAILRSRTPLQRTNAHLAQVVAEDGSFGGNR